MLKQDRKYNIYEKQMEGVVNIAILYMDGKRLRQMFDASARWLIANESVLNDMNVFPVPDGDTGTNMGSTLRSLLTAINSSNTSDELSNVAERAANAALLGARGNSGVILSQMVQGFYEAVKGKKRLNSMDIAVALKCSYEKAWNAVVSPNEGTILTVLRDSVNAAYETAKTEPDIIKVVDALLKEARSSLANTPNLLPVLKEAGVVDAGAMGFVLIVEGIEQMMKSKKLPDLDSLSNYSNSKVSPHPNLEEENYGYCTEFFINSKNNLDTDVLRNELLELGDSLVIANSNSLTKIHIHTLHPGSVLEKCMTYGVLTNIKIDNMDTQHNEQEKQTTRKQVAFVAVALGEGIVNIFESMGCDTVIKGGQTMNPSVSEISESIKNINAEQIVILPNNSNVILSAEQVQTMHPNLNIHIVPSKTVPEGFSALLAWNIDSTLEDNIQQMNLALKQVKTGEIIRAARNATINNINIKVDDIIAITDSNILNAYSNSSSAVLDLMNNMINEDSSLVTLLYSENIMPTEMEEFQSILAKEFPMLEIEHHHGGQPDFSIIVSVE